jgi:hypothetical protein
MALLVLGLLSIYPGVWSKQVYCNDMYEYGVLLAFSIGHGMVCLCVSLKQHYRLRNTMMVVNNTTQFLSCIIICNGRSKLCCW